MKPGILIGLRLLLVLRAGLARILGPVAHGTFDRIVLISSVLRGIGVFGRNRSHHDTRQLKLIQHTARSDQSVLALDRFASFPLWLASVGRMPRRGIRVPATATRTRRLKCKNG